MRRQRTVVSSHGGPDASEPGVRGGLELPVDFPLNKPRELLQ